MNSKSMQVFYFLFFIFKFDCPIAITVFKETYSDVLNRIRVQCIFFFFLSLTENNSILKQSSFSLKLNFEKIEFQNRDILLNF